MYLRDHLEKLRYFYEVAKAGSFKSASNYIHLTQPSLTKSIKVLEDAIGKELFNRQPRGVSLTTEGEILYRYCQQLFQGITEVEQQLLSPQDPYAGSIRVGTYESIATYFWPHFLKEFLPKHPNLSFDLTTGRSLDMQKMLENEELDLVYIIEPRESSHIESIKIGEDKFNTYTSTKTKKIFSSTDDAPLILMPSALTSHGGLENFKETYKIDTKSVFKTSSLESVKELTLAGLGIGLLPTNVASSLVKAKKLKRVSLENFPKEGIGSHQIGLAYLKSKKDSKLLKELIRSIKSFKFKF